MIKHYVEFELPGAMVSEVDVRPVASRVPAQLSNVPEHAFALSFIDREERDVDGELLTGKWKNRSARILFGVVYDLDRVKSEYGERSTLYRNAERYGGKLVKCITGNFQPAKQGDIVLAYHDLLSMYKQPI